MQAKVIKKDHYWIVTYDGDTVGSIPGPLPEVLEAIKGGAHEVILDLKMVKYLHPNAIEAFRDSLNAAKKFKANIGIASPAPNIRRMLKLSGLAASIPIYHSDLEAISKLDLYDFDKSAKRAQVDKLLVCQIDEHLAKELKEALKGHSINRRLKYQLEAVRKFSKAIEILQCEKVDCILISAKFPSFKSIQFIDDIRVDTQIPRIPILVAAPHEFLAEAEILVRNGAHDILRRPFDPLETAVRLQTVISFVKDHRPFTPREKVVNPRGWKA